MTVLETMKQLNILNIREFCVSPYTLCQCLFDVECDYGEYHHIIMSWLRTVVAMHIQVSEATFAALTASQLGYVMKQRGEVEIKVWQVLGSGLAWQLLSV